MGGVGNNEPDLPFIDLYDSAAPVAPTNLTRFRRSGNTLQVSTDGGVYQTIATGTPGANNILNIDEPPLPFLDVQDGGEPVSGINRTRIARLAGNVQISTDGGAYSTLAAGVPGANNILPTLQPMELVDVWDSAAPVAPTNTMRITRKAGVLVMSIDCGSYVSIAVAPPGTPSLWYDAQNIDGLSNSSMIDGQQVGTWLNLGSLGVSGNLVQAVGATRPLFRLVATPGKINNRSAVENTGTMQMSTAALTVIPQPSITAMVFRQNSGAAAASIDDNTTGGATDRQLIQTNTGIVVNIYAGTAVVATGNVPALTTWETLLISWNGASTFGRLNGVQGGNVNPGANGIGSWKIFNQSTNGEPWVGYLAEQLIWSGSLPSAAAIEAYLTAKYAATPQ